MKDLSLCLREYPSVLLEALAQIWAVESPARRVDTLAEQIAAAMTQLDKAKEILGILSDREREALATVLSAGGAIRAYLLYRQYGNIRPLGPNPMRRLKPWASPQTPTEGLFYRGLLFRTYGVLGEYRGEILFIPPQLLAVLPPMRKKPPVFTVETVPPPKVILADGDALCQDILIVLAYLRRESIRSRRASLLSKEAINRLSERWWGEREEERLALIQRLLWRLRFVEQQRGYIRPAITARDWLRASEIERHRVLLEAWQGDPSGHELQWVRGIRCEGIGWQYDAPASRRTILTHLARCPTDEWVSLPSFIAAIKHVDPDFLRPDGDYNSWYIRDTWSNEYLTGYGNWDRIEGALIAHLVTAPLRWLGIVAVGYEGNDGSIRPARLPSC